MDQARSQVFSLGGGGPLASEASRRVQSSCAASGASKLWQGSGGAVPWPGLGGHSPPEKFREIGCLRRHLALKKFVLCRTAINWD